MTNLNRLKLLQCPTYTFAEVGRLVGISKRKVRRWCRGSAYPWSSLEPVVIGTNRVTSKYSRTHLSFLELVDLLFVKCFVDEGVSLQDMRQALNEARRILGTNHFARGTLFAGREEISRRPNGQVANILQLLSDSRWMIAPVALKLAGQIDFGGPDESASRWYPLGREQPVVIDPAVAFGSPRVDGRGTTTAVVYDFYLAEGNSFEAVQKWWEMTAEEARAAVRFEEWLGRPPRWCAHLAS